MMSHSEEATLADPVEHYHIARADSVSEPVDARITPQLRANEEELDTPYLQQLSEFVHHKDSRPKSKSSADEERPSTADDGPLYVRTQTLLHLYQSFW